MAQATVEVKIADAPEVIALMRRAQDALDVKDAAIHLFLETEHPDEGCRFSCPGKICTAMRDALEAGR